jgi:hypothetical protein
MNIDQFADAVIATLKTGKWASFTECVETSRGSFHIGVKAYGKWVQILQIGNMRDGIPETKTWKAFRIGLIDHINRMVSVL